MAETQPAPGGEADNQQPGQVIAPGQATVQVPPEAPAAPVAEPPAPEASPASAPAAPPSSDGGVNWTASEFVSHEKSIGWYGLLALAAAALAAGVYFFTKDIISTAVVLVAALALAVLAGKKPRQLQYRLDDTGVTVGHKHFDYGLFKSFSVVPEGAFSSIVFTPLKRFAPLTTIYYAPEDEEQIVGLLTDRLPFEERKTDVLESAMRRIRF